MGIPSHLGVTIIGAWLVLVPAFAAPETVASDTPSLCSSLANDWKIAEAGCTTNANLGRARALARSADSKCKSSDAAQQKTGAAKYQQALQLCRKPSGN